MNGKLIGQHLLIFLGYYVLLFAGSSISSGGTIFILPFVVFIHFIVLLVLAIKATPELRPNYLLAMFCVLLASGVGCVGMLSILGV